MAATGHLYLDPIQMILRQELDDYPLGKNDDAADALALHQQLWRGVLSQERLDRFREVEQQVLRRLMLPQRAPEVALLAKPDDRGHMPHPDDVGWDPDDHRYGKFVDYQIG